VQKKQKSNTTAYTFWPKNLQKYTDTKVVNRFPHDPKAFTQGLEYHNGFLYESTGIKGQSSIRKTVLKTGEILQIQALNKAYFGEGITFV
jgi:glutamine cyclotransferase